MLIGSNVRLALPTRVVAASLLVARSEYAERSQSAEAGELAERSQSARAGDWQTLAFDVAFDRNPHAYAVTIHENGVATNDRILSSHTNTCRPLVEALVVALTLMIDAAGESSTPEVDADDALRPGSAAVLAPAPRVPASIADEAHPEQGDASAGHSTPEPPSLDSPPGSAPARTARNVLYAELLGNALSYSVNLERFFGEDASVRVGFGYLREPAAAPIEGSFGVQGGDAAARGPLA